MKDVLLAFNWLGTTWACFTAFIYSWLNHNFRRKLLNSIPCCCKQDQPRGRRQLSLNNRMAQAAEIERATRWAAQQEGRLDGPALQAPLLPCAVANVISTKFARNQFVQVVPNHRLKQCSEAKRTNLNEVVHYDKHHEKTEINIMSWTGQQISCTELSLKVVTLKPSLISQPVSSMSQVSTRPRTAAAIALIIKLVALKHQIQYEHM